MSEIAPEMEVQEVSQECHLDSDVTENMQVEDTQMEFASAKNVESESMQIEESNLDETEMNSSATTEEATEDSLTENPDIESQRNIENEIRRFVVQNLNHGSTSWSMKMWREKIMDVICLEIADIDTKATMKRIVHEEALLFATMSQDSQSENETERQDDSTQIQAEDDENLENDGTQLQVGPAHKFYFTCHSNIII